MGNDVGIRPLDRPGDLGWVVMVPPARFGVELVGQDWDREL